MNSSEFKTVTAGFGADLTGIAPVSRFLEHPDTAKIAAIFPQAETVIILLRRVPHGVLCTGNPGTFDHFGFKYIEDQALAKTTYDTVIWLEKNGFEGVPLFGYDAEAASGQDLAVPVEPGKEAPNVYIDFRVAAELCGLGTIGKNGLFLSPEFGPMQRLAMVLTDAVFSGCEVRKFDFCDGCEACAEACPEKAFQKEETHPAGSASVWKLKTNRCADSDCGALPTDFGRFNTIERLNAPCALAWLASLTKRGKISPPTTEIFHRIEKESRHE